MSTFGFVSIKPRYLSKCLFCPKNNTELKHSKFFEILNNNGINNNVMQYICERCDVVNVKRITRVFDRMVITDKIIQNHIPVSDLRNIVIDYLAEDITPRTFKTEGVVKL